MSTASTTSTDDPRLRSRSEIKALGYKAGNKYYEAASGLETNRKRKRRTPNRLHDGIVIRHVDHDGIFNFVGRDDRFYFQSRRTGRTHEYTRLCTAMRAKRNEIDLWSDEREREAELQEPRRISRRTRTVPKEAEEEEKAEEVEEEEEKEKKEEEEKEEAEEEEETVLPVQMRWKPEEDFDLVVAVAREAIRSKGKVFDWFRIAQGVTNRSIKQCKRRWALLNARLPFVRSTVKPPRKQARKRTGNTDSEEQEVVASDARSCRDTSIDSFEFVDDFLPALNDALGERWRMLVGPPEPCAPEPRAPEPCAPETIVNVRACAVERPTVKITHRAFLQPIFGAPMPSFSFAPPPQKLVKQYEQKKFLSQHVSMHDFLAAKKQRGLDRVAAKDLNTAVESASSERAGEADVGALLRSVQGIVSGGS